MSAPACWNSGAPFANGAASNPDHWPPTSHTPATSAGADRCAKWSQLAACPWPEPPAGPEEEVLQRRIEGDQTPSYGQGGPACAAFPWVHEHLRVPTSVAHLSHVFAP